MYRGKFRPSKAQKVAFANTMREIEEFCAVNNIGHSMSYDSYYFVLNGKMYRISNHTIEASNRAAYDEVTGEKKRDLYHDTNRSEEVTYIHAGKTRIIEIYNDLKAGYTLDGKGNRK